MILANKRILFAIVLPAIATSAFAVMLFASNTSKTEATESSSDQSGYASKATMTDLLNVSPLDQPRTGVPMLVAYPIFKLPDPHIELDESQYPWIGRTIQYGETPINEQELKEYWNIITTNQSHYFDVKSVDGSTKRYSIEYREPPIILEQYNVKAYTLDEPPEKYITVNASDQPWLREVVEESHTWKPIDIASATSFKQFLDAGQTFNFKVIFDDGHAEYYNIRYAGPSLATLN